MNSPVTPLNGLAKRLVYDEILDEDTVRKAQEIAQKDKKSLVSYLVGKQLADGIRIAEVAADEFGIPFIDLRSYTTELAPQKIIDNKLIKLHRTLLLIKSNFIPA
jgi:type IV pilus assembly protein PilB